MNTKKFLSLSRDEQEFFVPVDKESGEIFRPWFLPFGDGASTYRSDKWEGEWLGGVHRGMPKPMGYGVNAYLEREQVWKKDLTENDDRLNWIHVSALIKKNMLQENNNFLPFPRFVTPIGNYYVDDVQYRYCFYRGVLVAAVDKVGGHLVIFESPYNGAY